MKLEYEGVLLRNAEAGDAAQLAAWWNDGKVMAHAGFPLGLGTTPERIATEIAPDSDDTRRRLILEYREKPIGEMSIRILQGNAAEIGVKICEAEYQERGIGRIALSMLIGELFRRGYEKIVLDTNLNNTRAQHVYELLGFQKTGVRYDAWTDQVGRLQSAVDYELTPDHFVDHIHETEQTGAVPVMERLKAMSDPSFADFQRKLIPTVVPETVLGIRTPDLRKLAKEMIKNGEAEAFLNRLPHPYFDENQLHAFILSEEKDFQRCLDRVSAFLPYVDNWATCDQLSPKAFKKHRKELLPVIRQWLQAEHVYTVRFAIGMLMQHFLDDDFDPRYLEWVSAVRSREYYINMMIAWYFATALAKQYETALPYIRDHRLSPWTHNKAIQKAVESYRITPEQKAELKACKTKGKGQV